MSKHKAQGLRLTGEWGEGGGGGSEWASFVGATICAEQQTSLLHLLLKPWLLEIIGRAGQAASPQFRYGSSWNSASNHLQ